MKSTRARLILGAIVALLLLGLFFRGIDAEALGKALRSADPLLLTGVVLSTLLLYTIRAWRWGYLLAPMARVPYPRLFSTTFMGFMAGLVIPRAGELLRPYLVNRSHRVKVSAGFATIILERLFDLLTVLILFGLYLYVLPTPAAQTKDPLIHWIKLSGALAGAAALSILVALVAFHLHAEKAMAFFDRLLAFLPRGIAAFGAREMRAFSGGLAVLQAPARDLGIMAVQSVLLWLTIASSFYFTDKAFGLDLPFHASFLLMAFLTAGVAIPTPAGVGGFHEFYLLALTQVFGVERATAAAAGLACHLLTNVPILLIGLPLLWREGISMGRVAQMADSGHGDEGQEETGAGGGGSPEGRPREGGDPSEDQKDTKSERNTTEGAALRVVP